MSIAGLILGATRRWKLSLAIGLICVLISVAAALLMAPVYRSEAVVAVSDDAGGLGALGGLGGQIGGIAALAGLPFGRNENRAESLGIIRSRLVIKRLIADHDLMPQLFAKKWDPVAKGWKAGVKQPTLGDAYRLFERQILLVREDLKSGLITVRVDWTDRQQCAQWADWIIAIANEELRARAITESGAALAVLEREFSKAESVGLRTAISNVMEAQQRARTMAEVRKEFAFKIVDPPVVPDADKRVRPTRTLIVLMGAFCGALLAVLFAAFLDFRERLRRAPGQVANAPDAART